MLGPSLTYDDNLHFMRLIDAVRATRINVRFSMGRRGSVWFRRGWGLIRGRSYWDDGQASFYLGFGHPFNPLLWPADRRLLREIERVFLAHGSKRVTFPTTPSSEPALRPGR